MLKKRILLVAGDSQALADFQADLGSAWDVAAAADGASALAELDKQPCDAVVADCTVAEADGLEFLSRVQLAHPKTIRFVLAPEAERERMMKKSLGAHLFLGKPLEAGNLKRAFDSALALESWIPRNSIRELVARVRTLPTIPSLYLEVQALLKSPDATTEEVGAIIAKDMAMMTKLLQVLNSAAFALQRRITNPTEAVGILGFETVSSMVMAIKVLGEYDKVKPVYFSIDRLWRHSTEVARNAKELTLMHTGDRVLAELAFTGGLMHDIGKVVLAANFDEQYRGAQSLARKQQLPLCEVEKEIFGATHGEMGAYLLGLWGMPLEVLEVAALHHRPGGSTSEGFTALTAVHVANAFEHEINPDKEGTVPSIVDEGYLAHIGVLDNLAQWRNALATRNFNKAANQHSPVAKLAAQDPIPKKEKPFRVEEAVPVAPPGKSWVFSGLAGVAGLLLLFWLGYEFLPRESKDQPAGTPAPSSRSKLESLSPVRTVRARTEPTPPAPVEPEKPAVTPAPEAPVVAQSTTNFPDVKLQGIFFSASHPQAIINGKTVEAGDHIGEITVVSVKDSSVTLAYQNQVKVLSLK